MLSRVLQVLAFSALASSAFAEPANPEDPTDLSVARVLKSRFTLGIGAAVNRFDTSYKISDKNTGRSLFIDGEGSLELPQTAVSPTVYGYWRINQKHGLGFRYFSVDREGGSFEVDQDIGDVNLSGNLTVFDRSKFFLLNYGYTFSTKPDARVRGIIGIYGLDLRLGFEGEGEISDGTNPPITGEIDDEVNTFVPLPLLGVDFNQAVSDDWALGARFAMIGGQFNDVDGLVFDAQIRARYQISNHVGLVLAANYFSGDITINDDSDRQEIKYGYDGFAVGLDFNW